MHQTCLQCSCSVIVIGKANGKQSHCLPQRNSFVSKQKLHHNGWNVGTRRTSRSSAHAAHNWNTGCKLIGVGSSVPEKRLSNLDLEKLVETNDEWIKTRTGIRARHLLAEGESLGGHAVHAARQALEMADTQASDIDLVLLCTSTPDDLFGSACQVQTALGCKNALAFDITAACSGFVVGVVTAAQFIRTGMYKNILVIGADALSRYVDWRDRATCILFGDGCGAVVVTAQQGQCSLLGSSLRSDGSGQKHLTSKSLAHGNKSDREAIASEDSRFANVFMNGQEVFKFAVRAVPMVMQQALADAGLEKSAIDWLVLHQANQRILDSAAQRLGVPPERVISNLAEYGNTSAASIPLALDEAVRSGQIHPGSTLGLAGFGAGLTWGAAIVKWG